MTCDDKFDALPICFFPLLFSFSHYLFFFSFSFSFSFSFFLFLFFFPLLLPFSHIVCNHLACIARSSSSSMSHASCSCSCQCLCLCSCLPFVFSPCGLNWKLPCFPCLAFIALALLCLVLSCPDLARHTADEALGSVWLWLWLWLGSWCLLICLHLLEGENIPMSYVSVCTCHVSTPGHLPPSLTVFIFV